MKKIKRWLALLLAIVLVGSNAIYSMGSSLKANQVNGIGNDEIVQEEPAATTPDTQGVEGAQVEVVDEAQITEQPVAEPQESEAQQSVLPEEPVVEQVEEAVKYNVVINQPVEGGSVQAGSEEGTAPVDFDENGQFKTEITEGALFYLSITANQDYEVENVIDQNDTEIIAESVNEKVYSYKIQNITSDLTLSITYKEIDKNNTENVNNDSPKDSNEAVAGNRNADGESDADASYYKVTFQDKDGADIAVQEIKAGQSAVEPSYPEVDGYKFTGWDTDFSNVTGDMIVKAQYQKLNSYTITLQYILQGSEEHPVHVAQPYIANVEEGKPFRATVKIPDVIGFTIEGSQTEYQFDITEVKEDVTASVVYQGKSSQYVVKHMQQSADNDEKYELKDKETLSGSVGMSTAANPKTYTGFSAQPYANAELGAAGETVITIRYNRNMHLVLFDTKGGSYIAPQYVKYGAAISSVSNPTRLGYEFKGWDYPSTGNIMPDNEVVVNAKWETLTYAPYTIVSWKQKVNGSGYDYEESSVINKGSQNAFKVGQNIDVPDNFFKSYEGFERNKSKETDVAVTSDGKAVKNVYYDRKEYSISFYITSQEPNPFYEKYAWIREGVIAGGYTQDNNGAVQYLLSKYPVQEALNIAAEFMDKGDIFNPTLPDSSWSVTLDPNLTITARYGEDISAKWNDEAHTKYRWATSFSKESGVNTNVWYTLFANMPAYNVSAYSDKQQSGKAITYYLESKAGDAYEEYAQFPVSDKTKLTEEDKQPIDGFSFSQWKGESGGSELWLKYTRNSYKIDFANCTNVSGKSLKFQQSLSDLQPGTLNPGHPAGVDLDYKFAGWYTSPACEDGTLVNFNEEMPSHNLVFYAKWVAPEKTVSFETNGAAALDPVTVEKYQSMETKMPADPEKEGYTFAGWYTDKALTVPFVESQLITDNMILYAKWSKINQYDYTVICQDQDGKEIKDRYTESGEKDSSVTVKAPNIEGYMPMVTSQSLVLDKDGLQLIFTYKKVSTWEYTVKYIDGDTKEEISPIEKNKTSNEMITVSYKAIAGYSIADGKYQQQIAKGDENKEITFTYKSQRVSYKVVHHFELAESGYKEETETFKDAKAGDTVTAKPMDFDSAAYTLGTTGNKLKGIVKGDSSLVIDVYYNLKKANYSVQYYLQNKANGEYELKETETVIKQAAIGKEVSSESEVFSKTFEGYVYDSGNVLNDKTKTVTADGLTTLKRYYKLDITITYEPGEYGTFSADKHNHLSWGETTPEFRGELTAEAGYQFKGWNPEQSRLVKDSVAYVATWEKVQYKVTATVYNGTIKDTESHTKVYTVNKNGEVVISYKLNKGYKFDRVEVVLSGNTETFSGLEYSESYTLSQINSDAQVNIYFVRDASDLTVEEYVKEYDGDKHNIKVDGYIDKEAGETLRYTVIKEGNAEEPVFENPTRKNVCDVTVKVELLDKDKKVLNTKQAPLIITRRILTINPTEDFYSKAYKGAEPKYEASIVGETKPVDKELGEITAVRKGAGEPEYEQVKIYKEAIKGKVEKEDVAKQNFLITYGTAGFEIVKAETPEGTKLTAEGDSWEFDGKDHAAKVELTGEPEDADYEIQYYVEETGQWVTKAPTVHNVSDGRKQVRVRAVSERYGTIGAENAYISIIAKDVRFNVDDKTVPFGTLETEYGFTGQPEAEDLIAGEELGTIQFSRVHPDLTAVGDYLEEINANQMQETANSNYNLVVKKGTLHITTATVSGAAVTASGGTQVYNGKPFPVTAVLSEEAKAAGYIIQYKIGDSEWTTEIPSVTNVSEGIKIVSVQAVKEGNETLTAADVSIGITAKPVKVTVTQAQKEFGKDDPEFEGKVDKDALVEGDTLDIEYFRTNKAVQDVGSYADVLTARQKEAAKNTNYELEVTPAAFNIYAKTVKNASVSAQGESWVFDGSTKSASAVLSDEANEAKYQAQFRLEGDDEWQDTAPALQEVADGPLNVAVRAVVKTADGAVDQNYVIIEAPQEAVLNVTAKPITYTVKNAEKTYGEADNASTWSGDAPELVNGFDLSAPEITRKNADKDILPGTYKEVLAAKFAEGANPNYEITVVNGDFKIIPAAIEGAVVNAAPQSKRFDGAPLVAAASTTAAGYTVLYKTDKDADWSANAPQITNVAESTLNVQAKAVREGYKDLETVSFTLTVTPKDVTLIANKSNEKFYNTNDPDVAVNAEGLVKEGDLGTYSVTRSGKGTLEGEALGLHENVFVPAYSINNSNYNVIPVNGDLNIKTAPIPADADFTISGDTYTYDGSSHGLKTKELNEQALKAGYHLEYQSVKPDGTTSEWANTEPTVSQVNEGKVKVNVRAVAYGYAEIQPKSANIQITKRHIEFTIEDAEKDFGKPDPDEFKGSITSEEKLVAPKDLGDYSYYRKNKEVNAVGRYENVLDVKYTSNENYEVTVNYGTFEIKTASDRQAVVRATGGTFAYDKNAHGAIGAVESDTPESSTGWTIEYNVADELTGWSTNPLTKELSVTDVKEGTKTIYVRAVKEGYYPLETKKVTIDIKAIDAVITAPSYSKVYDGTLDIPDDLNCTVSGVLEGDNLNPTYKVADDTSPLPGNYNTAIIIDQYDTQNQNYNVKTFPNNLEITTAVAEGAQLTLSGGTHVYDGVKYYVNMAVLSNVEEPEKYTIEYSADGGTNWSNERPFVKDVQDNKVTVIARATRDGYEPITSGEATIQVTPKVIRLQAADTWKYFDDEDPVFKGTVDIEHLGLVEKDDLGVITYERIKKGEDVKVYEDAIEGKYTKNNSNYDVQIVPGDFEIRTASIANASVVSSGDEWFYDGAKHEVTAEVKGASGYTVKYSTDNGISWTTSTPSVTNVKDELNNVGILVKAERKGYETIYAPASVILQVKAKTITLKAADAEKYFEQEDPEFEGETALEELGLIDKDDLGTISFARTNKGQEGAEAVGIYPGVIEPKYTPNDNYTVTPENGDFEIKTAVVSGAEVTAKSGSWTYDGDAHKVEAELSKEAKDAGYEIWYRDGEDGEWTTTVPDITNVTDGPRNIYVEARKEGYDTLTIDKPYVTIGVTAKEIQFKVADAEKIFGGNDPVFEGEAEGLVGNDSIEMIFSREPEEAAGTYEKVITAEQNSDNYNSNYKVIVTPGNFTIKPAAVEGAGITVTGGSWEYDGESHKPTAELSDAAKDYTLYYSIDGGLSWTEKKPTVKEVSEGTKTVKVKAERDNYETLTAQDITISVYAKKINITVNPADKKYGEADPIFSGKVDGLVAQADLGIVSFTRTNADQNADVYENVIVPQYTPNQNYDPQITPGTFTIKVRNITLKAASGEKEYDGEPLTKDKYEETGDGFAKGNGFAKVTVSGSQTIPGKSLNSIGYTLEQNTNASNYNIETKNGELVVTDRTEKLPVKITAGSATIVYDGNSHKVTDYKAEGLLKSHTLEGVAVDAAGTQVGYYDVNVEGTSIIKDQNGNNVTKQYQVTPIAGKLTIMGQVFYDNNGGSGVTVDLNQYGLGAAVMVATGELVARDGAVFLGWSTKQTQLVTTKDAESLAKENIVTRIAMGTESIRLYAVWAEDVNGPDGGSDNIPDYDEFRITYDPNGAEGSVTDDNIYPGGYEATTKENGFTNSGYAFDGWNTSANGGGSSYAEGGTFIVEKDTILYAQWAKDVIGEGENPEEGDGIPDKYQVIVRYTAVNGTVNLERTVVTLRDKDNKPSVDGTGKLNRVAEATAQQGYLQSSLIWSPQSPQKGMEITRAVTFTANFSTTPTEPGTTPTEPGATPTEPTTPATPAPTTPATIIQTITEPLTTLADNVGEVLNARVDELVPVDNEGVPLANKASTDHKCCLLHLLLLLLALTVEIGYTKNMKKRQKRIFELRKELADAELTQKEQQKEPHIAS